MNLIRKIEAAYTLELTPEDIISLEAIVFDYMENPGGTTLHTPFAVMLQAELNKELDIIRSLPSGRE